MYDHRVYFDPISDELFLIKCYLNYTYSYENIPDRFMGTDLNIELAQGDFEDFLERSDCVHIGHL